MAYQPEPAGPKSIREMFHYVWKEFRRVANVINDPNVFEGAGTTGIVPDPVNPTQTKAQAQTEAVGNTLLDDGNWGLPTVGFEGKPIGEPVFLAFYGDSNCGGGINLPTTPPVQNLNVFDWSTDGVAPTYSWRVADPAGVQKPDYDPGDVTGYTGLFQGGYQNMGWACADYIQKRTGRPVYLCTVWRNSSGIEDFTVGGDVYQRFTDSMNDASASPEINNRPVDVCIHEIGALNDANLTSIEFIAEFKKIYDGVAWNADRKTQWLLPDFPEIYMASNGQDHNYGVTSSYHEYVRAVSGEELTTSDGIHWLGDDLESIGVMCGMQACNGISALPLDQPPQDLVVAGYGAITQTLDTVIADIAPAVWITLPANVDVFAVPVLVTQDSANNALLIDVASAWQITVIFALTFTEVPRDRNIGVRVHNATLGLPRFTTNLNISRNSTSARFSSTFILPVQDTGDQIVVEVGDANETVAGVVLTNYQFSMVHVGSKASIDAGAV